MGLRVIEGGLMGSRSRHGEAFDNALPGPEDVRREAQSRLKAAGYDAWRNRHILTGIAIPRDIGYLAMQIGYVSEALAKLADIPADFRSDIYWPS